MKYEKKMGKSISFGFRSFSDLFANEDIKTICDDIFFENNVIGVSPEKIKDGMSMKAFLNDGYKNESSISVTDTTIIIVVKKEYQTIVYRISLGPECIKVIFEERPNGFIVTEEKCYYSSTPEELKKIISKVEALRYIFKDETINKCLNKISGRPSLEDFRDFYVKKLHQFPEEEADLVSKFVASFEPAGNVYMINSNNYKQSNSICVQTSIRSKDEKIKNYINISEIYKGIKKEDKLRAIYGLYMGEVNSSNYDLYPKIVNGMLSGDIDNYYYDMVNPGMNESYGEIENKTVGLSKVKLTQDYKNKIDRFLILNSEMDIYESEEDGRKRS